MKMGTVFVYTVQKFVNVATLRHRLCFRHSDFIIVMTIRPATFFTNKKKK